MRCIHGLCRDVAAGTMPPMQRATTMWTMLGLACSGDDAAGGSADASASTSGSDSDGSLSASTDASLDSADSSGGATTGEPTRPSGWSWTFEQGTPGAAVSTDAGAILDDSGNQLHATASAGLHYVVGLRPDSAAIAFAGDGAHLAVEGASAAAAAELASDDSMRIELTFRTDLHGRDGLAGAGTLLEHGPTDGARWWLGIVDGRVRLELGDGEESITAESSVRVDDGVWHRALVAFDRDAGQLAIAVDGTDDVRVDVRPTSLAIAGADAVLVGVGYEGERAFAGELDELAFDRIAPPHWTPGARRSVTTVFAAGAIPRPDGGTYHVARIPAVVALPSGTLLAFAEGRAHDICDIGDIDVLLSRSDDGGATWSVGEALVDAGNARVANPIPIVDVARNRVVLMTMTQQLADGCSSAASGCCEPASGLPLIEVRKSDDDGISFGAPIDVTADVLDPSGSSILIGPSHGIQLALGPDAGALLVPAMHRRSEDGKRGGHLLRSVDGGETWAIALSETDSDVNVNESTAVELADGRVLINTRHQLGSDEVTPAQVAAGLRGEALVDVDGSWADDPPYERVTTFRGPVVHGTLLAWPGSERYGDDRRLLFSLPTGEHGSNFGRRHDLRLWISHDDGATWTDGVRLDGNWTAYSDMVAIDDGHIGVLYEADAAADDFYRRIDFLRAAVQPLDDPTLASWTFEELAADEVTEVRDGSPFALTLGAAGNPLRVEGRHASSAVRFAGDARLCRSESDLRSALDIGPRDAFALEVVFRTEMHASGGAEESGVLVGKTRTGTEPAWWLRIEDGRARFLASACAAETSNCGVLPGECDTVSSCANVGVLSATQLSDGMWHRVVVVRDPGSETLRMTIDDDEVVEDAWPSGPIVKNDEPLCIGAFADGARQFAGDIDLVRIRSRPTP